MPRERNKHFARARARHLRLGRRGERLAGRALEEIGFDILTRNYRCSYGEIDLVAREGLTLCFIEVKTRRSAEFARPAAAVGREKRRRIIRAAQRYLREIGHPLIPYRFDIVEVVLHSLTVREITLHRAAFTPETPRDPNALRFPSTPSPGSAGVALR